jgi:hypothetical protein
MVPTPPPRDTINTPHARVKPTEGRRQEEGPRDADPPKIPLLSEAASLVRPLEPVTVGFASVPGSYSRTRRQTLVSPLSSCSPAPSRRSDPSRASRSPPIIPSSPTPGSLPPRRDILSSADSGLPVAPEAPRPSRSPSSPRPPRSPSSIRSRSPTSPRSPGSPRTPASRSPSRIPSRYPSRYSSSPGRPWMPSSPLVIP